MSNKPERVQNIAEGLCAILNRQAMLASEASSLQGQLNFVQGQLYGCTLKPAMAYLSEISNRGWRASDLELLPMMVTYVLTTLRTAPPRTLSVCDVETPVLLFTDGSYEPERGGYVSKAGLVFVDQVRGKQVVQEVVVPQRLVDAWAGQGKKQLIAYIELWPVVAALTVYGQQWQGRRLVSFIDNNSVRDALTKGASPVGSLFAMLASVALALSRHNIMSWFTRILSASNPADWPSRGKVVQGQVMPPLEVPSDLIGALSRDISFIDCMQALTSEGGACQGLE